MSFASNNGNLSEKEADKKYPKGERHYVVNHFTTVAFGLTDEMTGWQKYCALKSYGPGHKLVTEEELNQIKAMRVNQLRSVEAMAMAK